MIHPSVGDIVLLRDNRLVCVTDVSDPDPDAWRTYDKAHYDATGEFKIASETTPETIMVGYAVHPELWEDPNIGEPGYEPRAIVTDLSEVVSILE